MSVKVTYKPEYSNLVSPQSDLKSPIYNWHSFKQSFSRDLVQNLISEFNLKKGSWILDPFCGGGTTLLSSQQLNINAQGVDILPFAVFLSNVKTRYYDEINLIKLLKKLRKNSLANRDVKITLPEDIPLLEKAFPKAVKDELLRLKQQIAGIKDQHCSDFFNLAFLSILESVSNTSKDGGFLRIIDRSISPELVRTRFLDKCTTMISDVIKNNNIYKQNGIKSSAKLGDARRLPLKHQYDAIITSPPYPNRHDYTRIYLLEMIFDFISNNADIKKIRYGTIRSHVEARKKYEAPEYVRPTLLKKLISQVKENGTNNPQVIRMLDGYFEDMFLVLKEMYRCIKVKGKTGLVISNVRFAGVNIPADAILSEISLQVGFSTKAIWVARNRGNSPQQMRNYKKQSSRESIIILEKN